MAKTESTAVNELIDLVQGPKPVTDGAEDLMFSPPKKPTPPRMTGTVPGLRAGGEVAPLPRDRTPTGTSQHNLPKMAPPPVPVRMVTAPPTRSTTIPPLPRPSSPQVPSAQLPPPARPSAPELRQTKQGLPPPTRTTPRPSAPPPPTRTSPPPTAPVAAPFEARPRLPAENPVVAPPVVARAKLDETGDVVSAENWFEPSRMVEKIDEGWSSGTLPVQRRYNTVALLKKLAAPIAIALVVGVMIGGFLVFNGEGGKKRHHVQAPASAAAAVKTATDPAPAAPSAETPNAATATAGAEQPQPPAPTAAAPAPESNSVIPAATAAMIGENAPAPAAAAAPAPAPAVVTPPVPAAVTQVEATPAPIQEVKTPRGVVKLANVRIDSKPSGATVMLVDNGKTSFLGTTPVAASLDPARAYDVVLTLEGRPTQMAHLDPTKARHLEVTLGKAVPQAKTAAAPVHETAPAVVAAPAPAPAPAPAHHQKAAKVASPTTDSGDVATEEKPAAAPKPAGNGTLMVNSKPPCELVIDGKPTGLTTPQRAIPLAAGAHKITFVNATENINKTVSVAINAGQPTKLIQNLMQ